MPDVLWELRDDGVALITLNRPERLNAMGGQVLPLLAEYLAKAQDDPEVRCVALTGAGRAFCAGGDIGGMEQRNEKTAASSDPIRRLEALIAEIRRSQRSVIIPLHTMPKPTVALVNGVAVGAGFSIALACDIRLVSDRARFGTAFRNVGLSGDYGGSYFLQRLIGYGRARELYYTAELFEAQRALDLGIANHVYPAERFMDEGLAFCANLAAGPTSAFARMKDNHNVAALAELGAALDHEGMHQRRGTFSEDHREAVKSFLEKRPPRFSGR